MTYYHTSKLAVAYLRVSTEKQGEFGIGLEAQRASIKAYAAAAGVEIIEWFQDVASGRGEKSLQHRKGLQNALAMSKEIGADVLVDGLDRLSRHTGTIEKIFKDNEVMVVSVSEGRTINPLVIVSRAARAEFQGKRIAETTKSALSKRKASGMQLGNPTNLPEAQKLGAASNRRRSEKKIDEIADAIRKNNWHDHSVPALVEALNESGLKSSRNDLWTAASLRRPYKAALQNLKAADADDYKRNPMFGRF